MTFHLPGYDSCVTSMNALSSATFETAAFILNSGNLSPTVSMVSLPPFASVLSSDGAYSNAWTLIGPIDYFQFYNRLKLLMRRGAHPFPLCFAQQSWSLHGIRKPLHSCLAAVSRSFCRRRLPASGRTDRARRDRRRLPGARQSPDRGAGAPGAGQALPGFP